MQCSYWYAHHFFFFFSIWSFWSFWSFQFDCDGNDVYVVKKIYVQHINFIAKTASDITYVSDMHSGFQHFFQLKNQ